MHGIVAIFRRTNIKFSILYAVEAQRGVDV
jgi:hypothetical protein